MEKRNYKVSSTDKTDEVMSNQHLYSVSGALVVAACDALCHEVMNLSNTDTARVLVHLSKATKAFEAARKYNTSADYLMQNFALNMARCAMQQFYTVLGYTNEAARYAGVCDECGCNPCRCN